MPRPPRRPRSLRDLRLEREYFCIQLNFAGASTFAVGDRERLDPRQLPRETLRCLDHRLSARCDRRVGRAKADDPRALDGRDQVRRD